MSPRLILDTVNFSSLLGGAFSTDWGMGYFGVGGYDVVSFQGFQDL